MLHRDHLTRRLFAAHTASLTLGPPMLYNMSVAGQDDKTRTPAPPIRIHGITLQTSQSIGVMKSFYADSIGFPVARESEDAITFQTGTSTLTFEHAPGVDAFYHFAFNIPENQIAKAHAWQKERTDFIVPPPRMNDPGLAREVVAFRNWNAHSVFFWDPAGSAVEYIARHTLGNARGDDDDFTIDSILHLSEIAFITDNVPATAKQIKMALSAPNYSSKSEEFEALGNEHGLLLVFKKDRPMAFGQGGSRDVFPTRVELIANDDEQQAESSYLPIDRHPYQIDIRN